MLPLILLLQYIDCTDKNYLRGKEMKKPTNYRIIPTDDIFDFAVTKWRGKYYCGSNSDKSIVNLFHKVRIDMEYLSKNWTLKNGRETIYKSMV